MHLILSSARDPHTALVTDALDRQRAPYVVFDTAAFPGEAGLALTPESGDGVLILGGRRVPLAEVTSVWLRRPQPTAGDGAAPVLALRSLADLLAGRFWINPVSAERAASRKPYQLAVAREVGLDVPLTIVTNRPDAVLEFSRQCRSGMVYKSQASRVEHGGGFRVTKTSLVTEQDLDRLASVSLTPCTFQEYIPKTAEYRVTAIGDRVFSARARRRGPDTAVDWRENYDALEYDPHPLPAGVEGAIRAMLARLGLVFGCFDFVESLCGRLLFLEVNPAGQWFWIEQRTGLPLLESFTKMLVQATPSYR